MQVPSVFVAFCLLAGCCHTAMTETTTAAETTTARTDVTTAAETTTAPTDMTTAAETTTAPTDMTTAAETTTAPTDMTTAAETTTAPTDMTTAAETTTAPTDMTTAAETTTAPTDMTTAAETTTASTDMTTMAGKMFTPQPFIIFVNPKTWTLKGFCKSKDSTEMTFKVRKDGIGFYRIVPTPVGAQKYCKGIQMEAGPVISVPFNGGSISYKMDLECTEEGNFRFSIYKENVLQATFEKASYACKSTAPSARGFKWMLPAQDTKLDVQCDNITVSAESGKVNDTALTPLTYVDDGCNGHTDGSNDCYCHGMVYDAPIIVKDHMYMYLTNWKWGDSDKYVSNIACVYPKPSTLEVPRLRYMVKEGEEMIAGVEVCEPECRLKGFNEKKTLH